MELLVCGLELHLRLSVFVFLRLVLRMLVCVLAECFSCVYVHCLCASGPPPVSVGLLCEKVSGSQVLGWLPSMLVLIVLGVCCVMGSVGFSCMLLGQV